VAEQISSTEEIPDRRARRPIRETPDKNKSAWRDGFLAPAQDGTPFAYAGYYLDLFVDHLPGQPIDRHMHAVMLLPFHDEIILKAASVRFEVD
jgi:hypothetical protein